MHMLPSVNRRFLVRWGLRFTSESSCFLCRPASLPIDFTLSSHPLRRGFAAARTSHKKTNIRVQSLSILLDSGIKSCPRRRELDSVQAHFDLTSEPLRFNHDFTSASLRTHFDSTSTSLRFHIGVTSSGLRVHFNLAS